ncbi:MULTISPECIES: hypothetical protein [Thalassospira]|uniref:hypothetical protein n=1 Tax=Thalassospira TaxID=168934 RepID=UPI000C5D62D4|nr:MULTISPECIES: hypothetical protein [Thalassospira]MAB32244.1 hypothetical protein [Thalassospira sp.]HBS22690.1 hypothetical protein [Thalassospira sp.]
MIGSLLLAAPALLKGAQAIYSAVTGDEPAETAEGLSAQVETLSPEQRARVIEGIVKLQSFDTERFMALTDGDADKVRATARPEIALQAMGVIRLFGYAISALFFLAVLDWALKIGGFYFGFALPGFSVWESIADAAPVAEMVWAPALGAFWACVSIIRKYMGCRERDKAIEAEVRAGKPLNATSATVVAAAEGVAGLVHAFKKK